MYLHGRMVSVLVFQTEEWDFNPRAVHYFFFFFFFFCLRNIYYHIRALNASHINASSNLLCLFALRLTFSVPVNNFMSCVAEPPYPGHKARWQHICAHF